MSDDEEENIPIEFEPNEWKYNPKTTGWDLTETYAQVVIYPLLYGGDTNWQGYVIAAGIKTPIPLIDEKGYEILREAKLHAMLFTYKLLEITVDAWAQKFVAEKTLGSKETPPKIILIS